MDNVKNYHEYINYIQKEVADIESIMYDDALENLCVAIQLFVEQGKRLAALGVFPEGILADAGVIPKQNNFPPIEVIKDAGYTYDGNGNIRGIPSKAHPQGKILGGKSAEHNDGYPQIAITFPHTIADAPKYGSLSPARKALGYTSYQTGISKHTLVFAMWHNRWPRMGMQIDHFDDDKNNNHHTNLKERTSKQNNSYNKLRENIINELPEIKPNALEVLFG